MDGKSGSHEPCGRASTRKAMYNSITSLTIVDELLAADDEDLQGVKRSSDNIESHFACDQPGHVTTRIRERAN